LPGETMPEPPAPMPVIAIPAFTLTETAPVLANLPSKVIHDNSPRPIEAYDISRGLIAYRTTLPVGPAGTLEAALVRDLAWVFVDGRQIGMMDTRSRRFRVNLPERVKPVTLEVLVYTISRVNFGVEIHDRKGLHGPVNFLPKNGEPQPVNNWEIRAIDFGADALLPPLEWQTTRSTGPAFWRGTFEVSSTGDTFLDVSKWGTGIVWVNGRCLGRFWNIGPTQTMYLPAPWMKNGRNEIIVLDLVGPEDPVISGAKEPILDLLHPEKDFFPRKNRGQLQLTGVVPTHESIFAPGPATQEIRFATTTSGRQFCLESIDAFDGKDFAAVGEIELLDGEGHTINQSPWTIAYADSEEGIREDGSALNAINGQASDHWHTEWSGKPPHPTHPHRLIIDLGANAQVSGFRYTPRQGAASVTGRIKTYRIYVGERLVSSPN